MRLVIEIEIEMLYKESELVMSVLSTGRLVV